MIEYAICLTTKPHGASIINELKPYFNVQKFVVGQHHIDVPVNHPRPQIYNYWLCIQKIVQMAKSTNLNNFLFLEEDAVLTPRFHDLYPLVLNEAANHHLIYDLFFLGSNNKNGPTIPVTNHIVQGTYTLDYHAVVFNWTVYDFVLSMTPNEHLTFDGRMADAQKKGLLRAYCASPSIITQKPGWSQNEKKMVNRSINHDI